MTIPASRPPLLRRISILTRLLVLSGALTTVLVGTTFYLTTKLTANAHDVERATGLSELVDAASELQDAFGEHRYWTTDLAAGLLGTSDDQARESRARLLKALDRVGALRPAIVPGLVRELDQFEADVGTAVAGYRGGARGRGNAALADARRHGVVIHARLDALMQEVKLETAVARNAVLAAVADTTRIASLILALAILLGVGVTLIVFRSIAKPLREVMRAVAGITAGRLDTPIPTVAPDEVGAMAQAVMLFRQSLAERERLAAERDAQSRMIETAIETISDGFVLYDEHDRMVLLNRKYHELLPAGLQADPIGRRFEEVLEATLREHRQTGNGLTPEAWLAQRLARHRTPAEAFEQKIGSSWVRISERRMGHGGTVAVYTDITELKQRQAELETATQNAEAASRAKSAFLANMSHELRTPLNAIIGYSEMLQEIASDDGRTEYNQDLEKIRGAGRHLLALISDILDLSKIEAGRVELFVEEVGIADLVTEVRALAEPLALANGNRLVIGCPATIGSMRSDRTKLKQNLLNLVSNACKFTRDGVVSLTVERSPTTAGDSVSFTVSDTGIGMTAAEVGRLFQAFTQADASTTKRFGGTGLGLAITRHFCEMLGGTIAIDSVAGRGSTFAMRMPDAVAEHAAATSPRILAAPTTRADAPLIMIVDDDAAARELIATTLLREGWRVVEGDSGEGAIELARALKPKAITLDVMMPRVDGWTVLSALKADPDIADIPVVMVSVCGERGIAVPLGAHDLLTKPIEKERLTTMLHSLLRDRGTVLVVDDDPACRELARRQLERASFRVAEAHNGREALAWLAANPAPALMLLDLVMPEMDGFEMLDALEAEGVCGHVPVVILSAMQLEPEEHARLRGRAQEVIGKGKLGPRTIAAIMRDALSNDPAAAPAADAVEAA